MRLRSLTAKAVCVRGALTLSALLLAGTADAGPLKRLLGGHCHRPAVSAAASCSAAPAAGVAFRQVGTASVPPVRVAAYTHTTDVPTRLPDAIAPADLIPRQSLPTRRPCECGGR